ncbi:MAG: GNAT family N-acetyltransferase, partial [Planctomycetota bacterium]
VHRRRRHRRDAHSSVKVTTTCYGQALAWIGMMLVHPEYRRRGIATDLMNQSLRFLRAGNVRCIKLDATPVGQPVYERLGFQAEWTFHRWQFDARKENHRSCSDSDHPAGKPTFPLDHQAFGVDRTAWLTRLAEGSFFLQADGGFGMIRAGQLADYLGPITAVDRGVAHQIIVQLLARSRGKVFWDIPGPNHHAIDIARQLGFEPVRDLTRMWLGDTFTPDLTLQFAICDPGTG